MTDFLAHGWTILAQGSSEYQGSDVNGQLALGAAEDQQNHAAAGGEAEAPKGEEGSKTELPTITSLVRENLEKSGNKSGAELIGQYENLFYCVLALGLLVAFLASTAKKMKLQPTGRGQLFVEFLVQGLQDYVERNLGPQAKDFMPFIASLFMFIWINNMIGVIPLVKAITSDFHTTLALGLSVFAVVQYHGIKSLGFGGWLAHLAGMPDAPAWMAPMNFPLHIIGELVKPISLALRLFGNIFGEDILIAAFVGLGAAYFLPLHFPFYFLAMLTSFVQAMVFTLLTCAYIGSMSHHHEEHHEGEGIHDAHNASHLKAVPGIPEGVVHTAATH